MSFCFEGTIQNEAFGGELSKKFSKGSKPPLLLQWLQHERGGRTLQQSREEVVVGKHIIEVESRSDRTSTVVSWKPASLKSHSYLASRQAAEVAQRRIDVESSASSVASRFPRLQDWWRCRVVGSKTARRRPKGRSMEPWPVVYAIRTRGSPWRWGQQTWRPPAANACSAATASEARR